MDRLIGKVLQGSCTRWALCVTEAVPLTENSIDPGLSALRRIHKIYCAIFAD